MSSAATPIRHTRRINGIDLAFFEWNSAQRGRASTLLLAHATGFHARCWDQMVRYLGERHVVAVDLRGHGRSDKPEITHWRVFGEDLAGLVGELALENVLGVGHSMGAHAMVDAAVLHPDPFRGLVLLDPVIRAPEPYEGEGWMARGVDGEPHPTSKRRNRFDSPAAMFERFEGRAPYSLLDREALWDYCEHGLLPDPDPDGEGYVLACPPATEASVYMTSHTNVGIFESVRQVKVPVLVVRAKGASGDSETMDFSSSPTWPELVRQFPNAREISLPELTHFLPMQDPARMAALVLGYEATLAGCDPGARNRS